MDTANELLARLRGALHTWRTESGPLVLTAAAEVAAAAAELDALMASDEPVLPDDWRGVLPDYDHACVILDGITELERTIGDDGEPWQGYEGGPWDPKTTRESYTALVEDVREWASQIT
jgi:hypothetical protein